MTKEEIEELKGLAASMGLYDDKNPCKRAVILGKAIEALEQEPRKGHWIEHPRTKELRFHHIYECSACKTQIIGNRYNVGNYKYCPHCGIEFEVEG